MTNNIETTERFLPKWVWGVVALQVFLVLFFSAGTAMNPGDFIPNASELNYVTLLYITRNVTASTGLGHCAFTQVAYGTDNTVMRKGFNRHK